MADIGGIAAILPQAPGGINTFLDIYGRRQAAHFKKMQDQAAAAAQAEKDNRERVDKGVEYVSKIAKDLPYMPDDLRLQVVYNEGIAGIRARAAEDLAKNPNLTNDQLYQKYLPQVQELSKYKQQEKAFVEAKNQIFGEYDKVPGFNKAEADAILNKAYWGMGDVNKLVTDPEQLAEALRSNLHRVITTNEGIKQYVDSRGFHDMTDKSGLKVKMPTHMTMYDDKPDVKHEKINLNATTQEMFMKEKDPEKKGRQPNKYEMNTHVYLQEILDKDGDGSVKLLDQNEFQTLMQDNRSRFVLEARVRALQDNYKKETGRDMDFGPVSKDIMMRGEAYRMMSEYSKDVVREPKPAVTNIRVGGGTTGRRPTQAELNQAEAAKTYQAAATTAITQDGIDEGWWENTTTIEFKDANGKRVKEDVADITPMFPGGQFKTGGRGGAKIYIKQNEKGTIYVVENPDADYPVTKKLTGKAADAYLKMYTNANKVKGYDPEADAEAEDEISRRLNPQAEPPKPEPPKPWYRKIFGG